MLRKALRGIGIALILLPEPFTTPFGLLLLGVAFLLSRSRKLSSRPYLRGLIKLYLNHTHPHSQSAKTIHHNLDARLAELNSRWPPSPPKKIPVTYHAIDDDRLRLKYAGQLNTAGRSSNQSTGRQEKAGNAVRHSLEERWANYDWPRPPRITDNGLKNPVLHRLGESSLVRGMAHSPDQLEDRQNSVISQKADKVIYHGLKHDLSGYVLPSVSLIPEKTVPHTIDMLKLERYYGRVREERETAKLAAKGKRRQPERIILRRGGRAPQASSVNPWVASISLQPSYN